MNGQTKDTNWVDNVIALGGMRYHSGKYTREEWREKTGVDPAHCFPHVVINSNGLCLWTDEAERLYVNTLSMQVTDMRMLTGQSFTGRYGI